MGRKGGGYPLAAGNRRRSAAQKPSSATRPGAIAPPDPPSEPEALPPLPGPALAAVTATVTLAEVLPPALVQVMV